MKRLLTRNSSFPIIILAAIILIGFVVRIYKLSDVPYGFFCDEASIGVNAFTILTKGTDEHGTPFPFFFRAFGEYKNPIQIYATVPFIAIFGLSEFSVRLTSVIGGVANIVMLYPLTLLLFKKSHNKKLIALLACLFLAISPWHIHFSRTPFEGFMPYLFFTMLGLFLFLKAVDNPKYFVVSVIAFGFGFYSYFPARLFIPLFTIGLTILYKDAFFKNKTTALYCVICATCIVAPFVFALSSSAATARWQAVSIFSNPLTAESPLKHIAINYISHFSLDFLFLKGDIGMPDRSISRLSVQGIGELYFYQCFLIALGIGCLLKKTYRKTFFILLLWLIFYPVGSMFTHDTSVQATRSLIGVIPFQIISATGLSALLIYVYKKRLYLKVVTIMLISAIIFFSFFWYLQLYFVQYPLYSAGYWGWQSGPREMANYFLAHNKEYDEFFMDDMFNEPYIFLRFYIPDETIRQRAFIGGLQNWNPGKKQLFGVRKDVYNELPYKPFYQIKHIITYPNGEDAFYLITPAQN